MQIIRFAILLKSNAINTKIGYQIWILFPNDLSSYSNDEPQKLMSCNFK